MKWLIDKIFILILLVSNSIFIIIILNIHVKIIIKNIKVLWLFFYNCNYYLQIKHMLSSMYYLKYSLKVYVNWK